MPEQELRRIRGLPGYTDFNRLARAIEAASRFTVGARGTDQGGPGGRIVRFDESYPIYGQVVSGAGPYDVDLVAPKAGGGWAVLAPGGTAYEVAGRADVPSGRVVELYPGYRDEWRFQDVRRGSTTTSICVTACSPAVPVYGATIQLLAGSTVVASCVTGATGCCAFTQSGTFTVKVIVSGTTAYSASRTISGSKITIALTSSQAEVICCSGYAIPLSLTLTDAVGSTSLQYCTGCSGTWPTWTGGHSVQALSCSVTTPNNTCVVASPTTGPVRICYQMRCYAGQSPTFTVLRSWSWVYEAGTLTPIYYQDSPGFIPGQSCVTAPPTICGNPLTDTASFGANPSSTAPFVLSGAPSPNGGNATSDPVGGTVAISA